MTNQARAPEPTRPGLPSLRLLLGGLLLGVSSAAGALARAETAEGQTAGRRAAPLEDTTPSATGVPGPQTPISAGAEATPLAAVLAGLLLESSRQAARGADGVDRSLREFADLIAGSGLPGTRRTTQAVAREAERMETRGRAELDRLASMGRAEEQRLAANSEAVFRQVAVDVVDEVVALAIERMAESPKVRGMIRQESSTVLEEFLDGVRRWCAQADDLVERGARRVFRRGRPRPATARGPAESPASASAAGVPAGPVRTYTEAGLVSRATALTLDAVIVTGAAAAGGYLLVVTLQALRAGIPGRFLPVVPSGLLAVLFFLYFVFAWATVGRTVGMAVLGLRVLTLGGGRVSFPRAVVRYAGYLLSTAFLFLGFLWVLIDDRRLGWLDHIARTKVVRVSIVEDEGS